MEVGKGGAGVGGWVGGDGEVAGRAWMGEEGCAQETICKHDCDDDKVFWRTSVQQRCKQHTHIGKQKNKVSTDERSAKNGSQFLKRSPPLSIISCSRAGNR